MEPLEARLLMSAVRTDAAFTTGNLGVGDDRSTTTAQSLGFLTPINFFGSEFSGLFVNNNGNVSFGARNSTFIDGGLDSIASKMIAPFYADVDTLFAGSTVRYGRGTVDGHKAFAVNWVDVDYYDSSAGHTNHNSFQLVLIDRSDLGAGNFDIEFNYDQILWESGLNQSNGNPDGLGGSSARVGFTFGDGTPGTIFEMAGSGTPGSFLDSNPLTGLTHHSFMSDVAGRYVYQFRDGTWADAPTTGNSAPVLSLPGTVFVNEGADGLTSLPSDLLASFSDPDSSAWSITVDYGDRTGSDVFLGANYTNFALSHTYRDSGSYVVTVTVDDGNGGATTDYMGVIVSDVSAPVLEVSAPGAVYEGGSVTLHASTANDPDFNDVHTFDWTGNGVVSDDGQSFTLTAADNGTYVVRASVRDQSGNVSYVDVPVVVQNLAPTASGLSANGPVDQGTALTVSLDGANDASSVDLGAGLTYGFDFDGDGLYEVSGASPSASHVYDQPGTYTVRGRVSDKDGGSSDYETSVVVRLVNNAPTATLVLASTANEGDRVCVRLDNASDSAADLAAGLVYSFDLDNDGVYELSGSASSVSHVFGDNGTYTVNARVTDRYGAHSDYSAALVVNNVAPVSSLLAPATGDEGAALSFSLGAVSDPSADDAAAGFTYSFDFDNDGIYEVSGTSPSVTHLFDDNNHYTVNARVTDKDGGHSDYSADVHVKNVAPKSPRFWDNNPKAEGTVVTVGFDAVSDPSLADTAAGFTYSYDFDNDGVFEVTSTSPTATHTFGDNGVYWVRGRVTDKDGGYEEYTTDVEVYNVAPTATLVTSGTMLEGSAVTVRLEGVADPSAADLAAGMTYSFDLDNDGVFEVSGSSPAVTRAFANDGSYLVRARVTDKDGGSTTYSSVIKVLNAAPTLSSFTTTAATIGSAKQGSVVSVSGSFADPGVLDTHTAVIDWGDGTTSAAALKESGGKGTLSGSHVYATGGIYNVTVRLVDNAASPGVATAGTKAYVTGVGLLNGVLYVVGTNGADKVTVEENKGTIKIKTDLLAQDPSFSSASVREVQVWLGAGNDKVETKGTLTRPVYFNGSLFAGAQVGTANLTPKRTLLFSDRLVAA
jgi:PKD repeat protein